MPFINPVGWSQDVLSCSSTTRTFAARNFFFDKLAQTPIQQKWIRYTRKSENVQSRFILSKFCGEAEWPNLKPDFTLKPSVKVMFTTILRDCDQKVGDWNTWPEWHHVNGAHKIEPTYWEFPILEWYTLPALLILLASITNRAQDVVDLSEATCSHNLVFFQVVVSGLILPCLG